MKTILTLLVLVLVAVPAVAGERPSDGGCPLSGASIDGFDCDNMCPLAKRANTLRAVGTEAQPISAITRKDCADKLEKNLARI